MKARGYVSMIAGAFIAALMSAVWIFVWFQTTMHSTNGGTEENAAFFGRVYFGFAMIVVCGFLGIANGIWMIQQGKPNRAYIFSIVILFIAACIVLIQA
jgi:hypothetical protein